MTIAYLNSEYPSLSHTFIEREVRALRQSGLRIRTISVRPTTATGRAGRLHSTAAAETLVLQGGAVRLLLDVVRGALRSPAGVARAVVASQRLAPPGIASRLRHLAYVAQGVRLALELTAAGISHVHVHMANNGAAIAMMACRYRTDLTYSLSIHGSAEFFHIDSWCLREKAEGAVFVRCISYCGLAQVMAWTTPESWSSFHVVRCGIEPELYEPRPAREPGPVRLITVGRLHPIKGYLVLLRACAALRDEGADFRLTIVGSGPEGGRLAAEVERLGLGEFVRLAGPVAPEGIPGELDRADAMVVSSFMEGVPVVLMEAMSKELGVISTRVGGVPELVQDGRHGLLADPGSAGSLAEAIRAYARDPDLCRTHGRAGRERVLREYGLAATAGGMRELFRTHVGTDAVQGAGR